MKRLGWLFALALLGGGSGCGESQCAKLCETSREKLIDNFGVLPEKVNCADSKWDVDCSACVELFKKEFFVVVVGADCEQL